MSAESSFIEDGGHKRQCFDRHALKAFLKLQNVRHLAIETNCIVTDVNS